MKSNFPACLALTLQYEGGYVNHPRDPGGPTNMGITIATLSHEMGRAASIADVQGLSKSKAGRALVQSIYQKKYWNLIGGDALPAGVDAMLFDVAVNSGPGRALQWANETKACAPAARIEALHARRASFWKSLHTFGEFGRGWMRRGDALYAAALAMQAKARAAQA